MRMDEAIKRIRHAQENNLTELYLNGLGLTELPKKLAAIGKQITKIDLAFNNIGDDGVQTLVQHCPNLLELKLGDKNKLWSGNKITDNGTKHIAQLTQLHTLDISYNSLSENGALHIAKLTQLHALYISSNNLSENGALHIAKLTQLHTLYISDNKLSENGALHIAKLTQLHTLDISLNKLSDNGALHIAKLTQLHTLYIRYNNLSDNGAKHISKLTQLHTLDISFNNLSDNGALHIAKLTQLNTLDISSNNLSDNGALHISKLTQLHMLYISSNNLSDNGAKHISKLTQLNMLNISYNNLSEHGAKHIAQLTQLHTLDISYNKIGDAGLEAIALSKNLQSTIIYLSSNEPNSIPKEIADVIYELRLYFKQREKETPIPNNIVRVIMCGNTETGKSSLTDKLVNIESEDIQKKDRTDGIRHVQALLPSNTNYTLNIWDFGGQDFYHATHVAALNKGKIEEDKHTLYCLLWHNTPDNKSKDPEQNMSIDYWLGFIQQMTLNPDIEIIQTHADLEPLMQFPKSKLLFSNDFNITPNNFHHISLKKNKINYDNRCKELWNRLNTHLNQIITPKTETTEIFPSWKDTRDKYLKELSNKGSYISRLELQNTLEIKTDGKIKLNDGSFGLLLVYLRACGYILFWDEYVADAYLREHVVIDIAGFHKEIYEELLKNRNTGEFEYKKNYQLHIAYLKENGIIFQHPKKPNTWVAPQFLPKESLLPHFQDLIPQTLTIRYPYYMPRYLITKFIVKAYNQYPDDKKTHYWKYGCISTTPKTSSYNTEIKYLVCIDATAQTVTIHIQDVKGKYALLKDIFNYFASFGDYPLWEEPKYTEKQNILLEGNLEREFYKELVNKKPEINGDRIEVSTNGTDYVLYSELDKAINKQQLYVRTIDNEYHKIDTTMKQIIDSKGINPKKIFISYSKSDLKYINEFRTHFANFENQGYIEVWYDVDLEMGEKWDGKIRKQLQESDIVFCCISPDFMANKYIWNVEMSILQEDENSDKKIIPIFISPVNINGSFLAEYNGGLNIKQLPPNYVDIMNLKSEYENGTIWIAIQEHKPQRDLYYKKIIDAIQPMITK